MEDNTDENIEGFHTFLEVLQEHRKALKRNSQLLTNLNMLSLTLSKYGDGGGESTGGQESQNGQQAGAEGLPGTPRSLGNMVGTGLNMAGAGLSRAGAGLINTPIRILQLTGIMASDQGNEDRGEVTSED